MPISIFNFPCGVLFRKRTVKNQDKAFGVEIEAEPREAGQNIFDRDYPRNYWDAKADGSLRNGGIEFASTIVTPDIVGPVFQEMREFIKWDLLSSTSPRTSVHVHLNFNTRPYLEVITFYALYVLIEDIITRYCGHSREGNIFAIESSKGMFLHNKIIHMITDQTVRGIDNNLRYSNINLASLGRFGTVEMRSMRGLTNPDEIIEWTEILQQLKNFIRGKTPKDLDTIFRRNPMELLPKPLLEWCGRVKFDWLGAMNSQYSLFYDLIGAHPTEWDMDDSACDFRNEPGLLAHTGFTEREAFNIDKGTWSVFVRGRVRENAPFNGVILNQPDFIPENPAPGPVRDRGRARPEQRVVIDEMGQVNAADQVLRDIPIEARGRTNFAVPNLVRNFEDANIDLGGANIARAIPDEDIER